MKLKVKKWFWTGICLTLMVGCSKPTYKLPDYYVEEAVPIVYEPGRIYKVKPVKAP